MSNEIVYICFDIQDLVDYLKDTIKSFKIYQNEIQNTFQISKNKIQNLINFKYQLLDLLNVNEELIFNVNEELIFNDDETEFCKYSQDYNEDEILYLNLYFEFIGFNKDIIEIKSIVYYEDDEK